MTKAGGRELKTKKEIYLYLSLLFLVAFKDPDYIGCSTEGHISHILSARLSSRPLSWCREGVDQMSRLRAFKANSGNVYDLVKERSKKNRNKNHKIRKPCYKKSYEPNIR